MLSLGSEAKCCDELVLSAAASAMQCITLIHENVPPAPLLFSLVVQCHFRTSVQLSLSFRAPLLAKTLFPGWEGVGSAIGFSLTPPTGSEAGSGGWRHWCHLRVGSERPHHYPCSLRFPHPGAHVRKGQDHQGAPGIAVP